MVKQDAVTNSVPRVGRCFLALKRISTAIIRVHIRAVTYYVSTLHVLVICNARYDSGVGHEVRGVALNGDVDSRTR